MGLGAWFLLIVFIITMVVMIKVLLGGSSGPKPENDNSQLEILKGRLERGEIDAEEFSRSKSELKK